MVLNKRLKKGTFYSDGTLVTNRKAGLTTVPDGTFVLWETLESGSHELKARKDQRANSGTRRLPGLGHGDRQPDFVEEDTETCRGFTTRPSIGEYWLINALGGEIDFQILRWRKKLVTNECRSRTAGSVRPLFGCWFRSDATERPPRLLGIHAGGARVTQADDHPTNRPQRHHARSARRCWTTSIAACRSSRNGGCSGRRSGEERLLAEAGRRFRMTEACP